MLPLVLGTVSIALAVTAGVVYCLPKIVPVKMTLTLGNQKR